MLGLLFALALIAVAAGAAAIVTSLEQRREREAELLFAGRQYREAIERYHAIAVNGRQAYPKSLSELLRDPRLPGVVRHLRQLYPDPITGKPDWGLQRDAQGGIVAVYSLSAQAPIKRARFPAWASTFAGAATYAEWRFFASSAAPVAGSTASARAGAPGSGGVAASLAAAGAPEAAASDEGEEKQPSKCEYITANDRAICAQQHVRWGDEAYRLCDESAQRRARACSPGHDTMFDLPNLVYRGGN